MVKSIEARAIISAADKTGGVFDKLAQKIKGVEKSAKQLGNIKAPRFAGDLESELRRLKLTEKELMDSRSRQQKMMDTIRGSKADHFLRARQDWMDREVNHWRNIKSSIDEAAQAHKRWKSTLVSAAGAVASRGMAMAGGGYAAYRAGRFAVKSAAENQREGARDFMAGLKPEDTKRFEEASLEGSRRFQSVDSQTMHASLREASTSMRSVDNAVALTTTFGEMLTVLQSLKGKDKAIEELRRFMSALDVLGDNLDPKQVRDYAMGFTKAAGVEGADFDLGRLLAMSKQLKSAGATVSDRFLMTTGVSLGRDMGDEKAGNAISMMMQQEVQATAKAKEYGEKYGLRGKDGRFVDRSSMQSDPDQWAWRNIPEAMKRAKLDPSKAEDVNTFLGSAYSNQSARNVLSKLMTQGDQYRAQAQAFGRAPGLDAAASLPSRDPFVAYEAVFAQLRTLSGQSAVMNEAAAGLNKISGAISGLNEAVQKEGLIQKGKDWVKEKIDNEVRDFNSIVKPLLDWDKRMGITPPWAAKEAAPWPVGDDPMGSDYTRRQFHSEAYWGGLGREGASASSAARLLREAAGRTGFALPGVTQSMTWGTGVQNQAGIEKSANVNVQGDLYGEITGNFTVEAGSELLRIVDSNKRLEAEVRGLLRTLGGNGPGSTGRSSPDAQAPGGTGFGGGGM